MSTAALIPDGDWSRLVEARTAEAQAAQVMHQRWENLLFLHWKVEASEIAATLPEGLAVDTFQGSAYVGITPFFMREVRPVGIPALPLLSQFQELNVRTYVRDRAGVPGIWFYSLDCNSVLAVIGARLWVGLPYCYAKMTARVGEMIDFGCRRKGSNDWARYVYRGCNHERATERGTLEFFLLERYFLYSVRPGSRQLRRGQVKHEPYRYREADLLHYSTEPARLDRLRLRREPCHACVVDGFDVEVFATEPA